LLLGLYKRVLGAVKDFNLGLNQCFALDVFGGLVEAFRGCCPVAEPCFANITWISYRLRWVPPEQGSWPWNGSHCSAPEQPG